MGNVNSIKLDVSRVKCKSDCYSDCCIFIRKKKTSEGRAPFKQKEQPVLELNLKDQVLSSNETE